MTRGNIRINSQGTQDLTIRVNANLETVDEVQAVIESVQINGNPVEFWVDRAGESFDITFEVDDPGDLAFLDCRILVSEGDLA